MATSASISASARLSDQQEAGVRPVSARSEDLPDTLCRLAAVNGETIGVGGVLHLDIVLEAAARHALILTGPDEFNAAAIAALLVGPGRSEEHTSELQSLMRHSYAVFCLKK